MERKTVVIAQSDLERQKAVCEQIREYWQAQGVTASWPSSDTYGCQQNEADSEQHPRDAAELRLSALRRTEEGADCIVINTCAIREHAEHARLRQRRRAGAYQGAGIRGRKFSSAAA